MGLTAEGCSTTLATDWVVIPRGAGVRGGAAHTREASADREASVQREREDGPTSPPVPPRRPDPSSHNLTLSAS